MRQSDPKKNEAIKQTLIETRNRRLSQSVKVVTVKIQKNKLNKLQQEFLKMCFVEAKWLYNYTLNLSNDGGNIFALKYNDLGTITHFDKDKNTIESTLTHLSSQMKQDVLGGIVQNIRNLAKAKEKGNKVGTLKFISEYNSINLKQANVSYKVVSGNKIKIQGCRKPFKVNGLEQLKRYKEFELANAKLIQKPSGYYVAITIYIPSVAQQQREKQELGIDMGCTTSLTYSDGRKINVFVEESERLKRLSRKRNGMKKGSNNRWRLNKLVRKEYEKMTNKKNDLANKIVHELSEYKVYMQDEQLRLWKVKHGKKVQHSVLGRVKAKLLSDGETVVLHKFVPTSKLCNECGHIYSELTLKEREFVCPCCGATSDRDVHAAENMIWISKNIVGAGRTEFKRVDFLERLRSIFEGLKHEAAESLVQR